MLFVIFTFRAQSDDATSKNKIDVIFFYFLLDKQCHIRSTTDAEVSRSKKSESVSIGHGRARNCSLYANKRRGVGRRC